MQYTCKFIAEVPFAGYAYLGLANDILAFQSMRGNPRKLEIYRSFDVPGTFTIADFLPERSVGNSWFKFESLEEIDEVVEMIEHPTPQKLLKQQEKLDKSAKTLKIAEELIAAMVKYPKYATFIPAWMNANIPMSTETLNGYFHRYQQTSDGGPTTDDFELFTKYAKYYRSLSFK
jgi:hypothetical protein